MTDRYARIREALEALDAASGGGWISWETAFVKYAKASQPDTIRALLEERDVLKAEIEELQSVCAEAYQVVGLLLDKQGLFQSEKAEKIMDNLSQFRKVHDDVLPWPEVEAV